MRPGIWTNPLPVIHNISKLHLLSHIQMYSTTHTGQILWLLETHMKSLVNNFIHIASNSRVQFPLEDFIFAWINMTFQTSCIWKFCQRVVEELPSNVTTNSVLRESQSVLDSHYLYIAIACPMSNDVTGYCRNKMNTTAIFPHLSKNSQNNRLNCLWMLHPHHLKITFLTFLWTLLQD